MLAGRRVEGFRAGGGGGGERGTIVVSGGTSIDCTLVDSAAGLASLVSVIGVSVPLLVGGGETVAAACSDEVEGGEVRVAAELDWRDPV
jgi:hypothetical protein